jgi:hypothetical protein
VAAGPHQDRRLVVRSTQATDRRGYIELFCTDEGRGYLGGALDRDEVEAAMPATPRHRPGVFAVELAGAFIGVVTLVRRTLIAWDTSTSQPTRSRSATCSFPLRGAMATRRRPSPRFSTGRRLTFRRSRSSCARSLLTRRQFVLRLGSFQRSRGLSSSALSSGSAYATRPPDPPSVRLVTDDIGHHAFGTTVCESTSATTIHRSQRPSVR